MTMHASVGGVQRSVSVSAVYAISSVQGDTMRVRKGCREKIPRRGIFVWHPDGLFGRSKCVLHMTTDPQKARISTVNKGNPVYPVHRCSFTS